jgi:hypothetical protein
LLLLNRLYILDPRPEVESFLREAGSLNDGTVMLLRGHPANTTFWNEFRRTHPPADILLVEVATELQQRASMLQEMLPHVRAGGVLVLEQVGTISV